MALVTENATRSGSRVVSSGRIDFVVIGAQRACSTLLQECLREHPAVWMPKDEVYTFEDPYYDEEAVRRLAALLREGHRAKVVGIKCPSYLGRPECAQRLYRYAPSAKLIVTLRNPVHRAVSAYYHYMMYGALPVAPIEIGLPRILNGEYERRFPASVDILEHGMFASHLRRYLQLYPRKQFFIMTDTVAFDAERLRDLYRFVDVDPYYEARSLARKVNEGIYSLTRIRFIRRRNKAVCMRGLMYRNRGLWPWMVNAMIVGFDRAVLRWLCQKEKPRPSALLCRQLYERYEREIIALEELLGEDLSAWRVPENDVSGVRSLDRLAAS